MSQYPKASEYAVPVLCYPSTEFDPMSVTDCSRCFDELLERPIDELETLQAWFADCMSVLSRVMGAGSRANIAHSRFTEDVEAKQRFDHFTNEIRPMFSKAWNEIEKKLMASPGLDSLDQDLFRIYLRNTREDLELFREENTELQAQDTQHASEYARLCGGLSIEHEGKTLTIQQTGPLMEVQDREQRESVWRKVAASRHAISEELDRVFGAMLKLRQEMAENAGFANFRDLRFRQFHRFDYDASDCADFHAAVEKEIVPLANKIHASRVAKLGLESLRPWDLMVDPDGAAPFSPYANEEELIDLALRIFSRVDSDFAADFRFLAESDSLDLWSRKGKAPGGYNATLSDTRLPFIFANSAGSPRDIRTVLHEGGHSFHTLLARNFDIASYRHAPIEFAEVASMSMELMCAEHFKDVFPADEAARQKRQQLEHIVLLFSWVATIDAFQHWLYTNQGHDFDERRAKWVELNSRFTPAVDWAGLADERDRSWHRQLHLFKVPFYYIEYAIAQIGALQVWGRYREDSQEAIRLYRNGLALGGSRSLPELFQACGARFEFGERIMAELAQLLDRELFHDS